MKRLTTATLAALSLAFTTPAMASPTSTFRAAMNKRCGDGARWYCRGVVDAYCRAGTCLGTYSEGDVLAGGRECFAEARVSGGGIRGYRDSCRG